jgi:hypothetical protein
MTMASVTPRLYDPSTLFETQALSDRRQRLSAMGIKEEPTWCSLMAVDCSPVNNHEPTSCNAKLTNVGIDTAADRTCRVRNAPL